MSAGSCVGANINPNYAFVAASLALLGSPALAEDWVAVSSTGIRVDRDTIRRGTDGLVYFTDNIGKEINGVGLTEKLAMDCSRRKTYVLKSDATLSAGRAIELNSIEDDELKFICANSQ